MNIKDWHWWSDFRNGLGNKLTRAEYKKVCELHSVYFEHKLKYVCTCNPKAIQKYIDELNNFWETKPKPRVR